MTNSPINVVVIEAIDFRKIFLLYNLLSSLCVNYYMPFSIFILLFIYLINFYMKMFYGIFMFIYDFYDCDYLNQVVTSFCIF